MNYKFVPEHFAQKTNDQIKDVLMNPEAESPAIHYYMVRGGIDQKNITVWEPGTVGGEYIKTYGHFRHGEQDTVVWQYSNTIADIEVYRTIFEFLVNFSIE